MRLIVLFAGLLLISCQSVPDTSYRYRDASRDGTGKVYMGREISQVMGHLGAAWLERTTRQREERTDLLLSRLEIDADDVVVDLGAGTGFFTFPIAAKVPQGKVLAVDIQPQMLDIIIARAARGNVRNVQSILATETNPNIPENSADWVLMVDAYHEFSHPREVMEGIVKGLRPGGLVVLVEYRKEDDFVPIKPLHKMSERQARKELSAAGLVFVRNDDYLPQQHVLVFRKPVPSS